MPAPVPRLSRRRWMRRVAAGIPLGLAAVTGHAGWVEPDWLRIRTIRLSPSPRTRFVQFTDLHFKGDVARVRRLVSVVNSLSPEFVCFTGDLIEEASFLKPALDLIAGIRSPLFGIPGNHDHWSGADFSPARKVFAATGGGWLVDEARMTAGGHVRLMALDRSMFPLRPVPGVFNLVLMHYPAWADELPYRADLLLAGHTHGGQVRLPIVGALITPQESGRYDLGMFETRAGPLYVNPGIGTFYLDFRLNCRPEVTVFEV